VIRIIELSTKPDDKRYLGIRRGYWIIALILIACGIAIAALPHHARADINETVSESIVIVGNETSPDISNTTVTAVVSPTPIPTNLVVGRRIAQGECVSPGETIDIAGLGWYTGKIIYYGRYYDGYAGDNSSWQGEYTISSTDLDHLFLKPDFFDTHLGWWYTYDDYPDVSSNNRLFYVATTCDRKQQVQEAVIVALNESQERAALIANASILPVRTESGIDLILNKNVDTVMDAPNDTETYWMFGTETPSSLYDKTVVAGNLIVFDAASVSSLPSETYNVVMINPGRNGIIEETYNPVNNSISSPFREQKDISLKGIASGVAKEFLLQQIGKSRDDAFRTWHVDLQDPRIYVMKLIQNPLPNNQSLIILAGYTNENQGANLTIQMDTDATSPTRTYGNLWTATALDRGGQVAYRVWNTSFIMDFNQVSPGQHSFTITSPSGGTATVPIYRRTELASHFQPPEEIAFLDNSPFLPTPTPIIIHDVPPTQIVIQTITIPVTPTDDQVKRAADASNAEFLTVAVVVIVVVGISIAGLYLIGRWLLRVYRRAKL